MTSRARANDQQHLGALWCLLVGVMSLVPILSGCSKVDKTRTSIEANNTDPKWVIQKTPSSKVAVVFVHGIFGDTLGTWTYASGKSFLQYLEEDVQVGPQLDMFAFGFRSNMVTAGSFDIQEAANKLDESLRFNQVLDYPTVVFVAHSMGGLVVLQELLTHRDLLETVPLIFLYATPQEGSQITTIAKKIARNPALEQMLPADRNAFLRQLNDQWKSLPARPHISCAYEKLATFGIMVVPWSSATRFCDGAANAITDADHLDIVKPNRPTHDSLVLLINALNTHVLGKQLSAKLETPDFVPEGDHVVFNLLDLDGSARLVNAGGAKLRFTLAEVSDSSLHLWPEDTPRDIPAKQTQNVRMALGFWAVASEYRFVVRTDVDLRVVVRVPNLAAVAAKRARLVEAISHDINNYLSVQANVSDLARLPPESTKASDEIVRVVHTTVATFKPEFPASAQWVISADILAAANWPQLAATALRRAESLSPSAAKSPGVRHLAGVIAAQTGESEYLRTQRRQRFPNSRFPKAI